MSRSALVMLRLLLAALLLASLGVQIVVPMTIGVIVHGTVATILVVVILAAGLCVEAVLVSVWTLVGLVRDDRIFDERGYADRWVSTAIVALSAAAATCGGGCLGLVIAQLVEPSSVGPALPVASGVAAVGSAALALVVGVMRRLLHTAIGLRSELAEVI